MIKIQHLKNIIDIDFKNNKTYELKIFLTQILMIHYFLIITEVH